MKTMYLKNEPKEGTPVAGWEKEGICTVCNKPVNFTDGFIWDGNLNKPVHYGCRDVAPCPSCEKLRGIIKRAKESANRMEAYIEPQYNINELYSILTEAESALNQPKGEG